MNAPRDAGVSTANRTRDAIYLAYERSAEDGMRAHLGASIIGRRCERSLWYDFRWHTRARHPGRVLRRFETGKREEERLVRNLQATGATVLETDPATGRQLTVRAIGGHFGGSLDALALGLLEHPEHWHVIEFKTHAAASFKELLGKGVERAHPMHFAQVQTYLALAQLQDAMYIAVNKDNDDLYIERIAADAAYAQGLLEKAERVIFARTAPERISGDPHWFECKWCIHREVCHYGGAPETNCRTCTHASPTPEGTWECATHQTLLDLSAQRKGCSEHAAIGAQP